MCKESEVNRFFIRDSPKKMTDESLSYKYVCYCIAIIIYLGFENTHILIIVPDVINVYKMFSNIK